MNKAQSIYIAGPMTGLPEHNFPAFHAAAKRWRDAGWQVANPAENFGGRTDLPRASYLRADVAEMVRCDAAAFLPDWQKSAGARLEYLLARELAMPVFDAETMHKIESPPDATVALRADRRESILDEANRITAVRNDEYGHPFDDFARTTDMWTAILANKLREDALVTAGDVPLCMIAVKLAREVHRHKRDNLVDIAGYARTAAMVRGEE